ncbi:hypothetical protein D3C87_1351200 [compost metagenome]
MEKMEKTTKVWHDKSIANMELLEAADDCGCFYCCNVFKFADIKYVTNDARGHTALCPHCEIDSVIPSTDKDLLTTMYMEWFTT